MDEATAKKAKEVGARIRACRLDKGISQRRLGPMIGLTVNAGAQWETGRTLPKLSNLNSIASVLGTTAEYLWSGKTAAGLWSGASAQDTATVSALLKLSNEQRQAMLTLAAAVTPKKK